MPGPSETAREVVHNGLDRQVPPSAWMGSPCPHPTVKLKRAACATGSIPGSPEMEPWKAAGEEVNTDLALAYVSSRPTVFRK